MNEENESIGNLEEIIAREIERHPHSQPLLEAFRPVIIARNRILEKLQLEETAPLKIDGIRFHGGIPVIGQYSLFRDNDPWNDIVLALIPAVKKGFADLCDDLNLFERALQEKEIILSEYFKRGPEGQQNLLQSWAEKISIETTGIAFILNQASRIVLEKRALEIADQFEELVWEKGYCPVCGSYPSLAIIGEKIGERRLYCSHCGYLWRFSRVICPYCEYEGQEGMDFFYIEDKPQESAFTCDQCKRYLITLNRVSDLQERNLDVSAIGLTHLDVILQEKGFVPMTMAEWNVF